MTSFDAGGGIRTRDFGDAPSDQPFEDYEPRTLTRLSYPGLLTQIASAFLNLSFFPLSFPSLLICSQMIKSLSTSKGHGLDSSRLGDIGRSNIFIDRLAQE